MTTGVLRPLERRVLALTESGLDPAEIARRFRRSPEFIGRVVGMARLPRQPAEAQDQAQGQADQPLRPIERRVLAWRDGGATFDDIAARFRRSPEFIGRVVGLAEYKLSRR